MGWRLRPIILSSLKLAREALASKVMVVLDHPSCCTIKAASADAHDGCGSDHAFRRMLDAKTGAMMGRKRCGASLRAVHNHEYNFTLKRILDEA